MNYWTALKFINYNTADLNAAKSSKIAIEKIRIVDPTNSANVLGSFVDPFANLEEKLKRDRASLFNVLKDITRQFSENKVQSRKEKEAQNLFIYQKDMLRYHWQGLDIQYETEGSFMLAQKMSI